MHFARTSGSDSSEDMSDSISMLEALHALYGLLFYFTGNGQGVIWGSL